MRPRLRSSTCATTVAYPASWSASRTRSRTSGLVLKMATTTFAAGSATCPSTGRAWLSARLRRAPVVRKGARGRLRLGVERQVHRQGASGVDPAYLDVAAVRASRAPHEPQAADASQAAVRALPAPIHDDGQPRGFAPLGAFQPYRCSAARETQRDADQGANRGAHQARIGAHLHLRLVAEDELHAAIARLRLGFAARLRSDAIQPDPRATQAALAQQLVDERVLEARAQPRQAVFEQPYRARVAQLAAVAQDPDRQLRGGHRAAQLVAETREPVAVALAPFDLAFESMPDQHFHGCVRERRRQPMALVRGEGRRVLQHRVEEEIREQAPLHRGTPPARRRRGHSRARQPETPLQCFVGGIEQLRQQLRSRLVEGKSGLGGGAQLPVPAVLQFAPLVLKKLAHALHTRSAPYPRWSRRLPCGHADHISRPGGANRSPTAFVDWTAGACYPADCVDERIAKLRDLAYRTVAAADANTAISEARQEA